MPWPWVTRRTYDDLMRVAERLQEDLRAAHERLAEAQRHAANSLATIREIVRPVPLQEAEHRARGLPPLPVAEPDEVAEAIDLAAGNDSALARHLARWAKKAKLDGKEETVIINSILHWKSAEAWDGSTSDTPYKPF